MGINTKIDMLTFAFGSGVAGIAGVALSQITNVGQQGRSILLIVLW